MGCGCGGRQAPVVSDNPNDDLMGNYKYLTDRQIRARLEVYKKRFCKDCERRYQCDYPTYVACKKSNGNN
jgi:hypothetical protein